MAVLGVLRAKACPSTAAEGSQQEASRREAPTAAAGLGKLPANVAAVTHQDEAASTGGDPALSRTAGPEGAERHPTDSQKCCSANARSSSASAQGGPRLVEKATLAGLPGFEAHQQRHEEQEVQKDLKWNQKRGYKATLVEKTREAFLLQMAVDTRKAG